MDRAPRLVDGPGLDAVLDALAADGTLVAPVERHGETVFAPVSAAAEVRRDYVNTLVPPRDLLLPSPERLAAYEITAEGPALRPAESAAREIVLFGVRSCDVAGFGYLERFLSGAMFGRPDLADPPFESRRRGLTVLSVVCQAPGPACMCVCCDGGPALERGYDWQLTALPAGWLVEIGSARGEALAARFAARLSPAPPAAVREKEECVRTVVDDFRRSSARRVRTMAASRATSTGRLPDAFWEKVGERCFRCGGCAYVCPTCSCFHVADVAGPAAGEGEVPEARFARGERGAAATVPDEPALAPARGRWERVRLRDCCHLPGFVRQAGGVYPRWTTGERCLTRFFHKLSWQFHERMGRIGCTGCGRCVQVCPGGIGIDTVAEEMTAAFRVPGARRAGRT